MTKRTRPTVAQVNELETKILELQKGENDYLAQIKALQEAGGGSDEVVARLKDAKALLQQASDRVHVLEGQLADALEGGDHDQAEDLPPCPADRVRYFVDLPRLHADYLERVATREGRTASNMIERIIRIDRSRSPDKGGAVSLGEGTSMPAADAPQIPITR